MKKADCKYNYRFFIQSPKSLLKGEEPSGQVVCRVRWNKQEVNLDCGGYANPSKWDKGLSRAVKKTVHKRNGYSFPAYEINRKIDEMELALEKVFSKANADGVILTKEAFKAAMIDLQHLSGKEEVKRKKKAGIHVDEIKNEQQEIINSLSFFDYWGVFVEEGVSNYHWQQHTIEKFITLKNKLYQFNPSLSFKTLDSDMMLKFQSFLIEQGGYRNVSVQKAFSNFRWFLRWCMNRKEPLITDMSVVSFKCRLRDVENKTVVFLTWDEFHQLYTYQYPDGKKYLERVRDCFIFSCATGLRYSDVYALTRKHVFDDEITVLTQKTSDLLHIALNRFSKAILNKYKGQYFEDDKALPIISNQKANIYLKEACQLAGIDSPIVIAYKRGGKQIQETYQKWQKMSFHSGRRTYVSLALALGASPEEVSRVSGHHSYQIMQKYIGLDEMQRKHATLVFDEKDDRETWMNKVSGYSIDELNEMLSDYLYKKTYIKDNQ